VEMIKECLKKVKSYAAFAKVKRTG
jgi:hypothetical protein